MPKLLNNDDGQTHQTLHGFNFSAVKIEDLGASEYTIVTIVVDVSGSVGPFKNEMELTLQKIMESATNRSTAAPPRCAAPAKAPTPSESP